MTKAKNNTISLEDKLNFLLESDDVMLSDGEYGVLDSFLDDDGDMRRLTVAEEARIEAIWEKYNG